MKHKSSKRSTYNKNRSYQPQTRRSSIPIDPIRTLSPNQIDLGIANVLSEIQTICLKPNVPLKSQKLLKRDLLRCSNQRPSFLAVQTLQPPRHHHHHHRHVLQQAHSMASSSSTSSSLDRRRHRSLSVSSHTFNATIDRIGPWPDITINRLRSDGNELLKPLKNFRNPKNPRLFSPKYYDNTTKFQCHSSNRMYIDEYRKQKGYLLIPQSTQKQPTSTSLPSLKPIDDDQLSAIGTFSDGGARNSSPGERSNLSVTNLTLSTRGITKSADDLTNNNNHNLTHEPFISLTKNQMNIFPALSIRNNQQNLRPIRPTPINQALNLPAISKTSLRYLNSIHSVEKAYGHSKKATKESESKLYVLEGRPRKRLRPVHKITLDFELPAAQ